MTTKPTCASLSWRREVGGDRVQAARGEAVRADDDRTPIIAMKK